MFKENHKTKYEVSREYSSSFFDLRKDSTHDESETSRTGDVAGVKTSAKSILKVVIPLFIVVVVGGIIAAFVVSTRNSSNDSTDDTHSTLSSGDGLTSTPYSGVGLISTPSSGVRLTSTPSSGDGLTSTPSSGDGLTSTPSSGDGLTSTPSSGDGLTSTPSSGDGLTSTPSSGDGLTSTPSSGDGLTSTPSSGDGLTSTPSSGDGLTSTPSSGDGLTSTPSSGVGLTSTPSSGVGLTSTPSSGDGLTSTPSSGVGLTSTPSSGDGLTSTPSSGDGLTSTPFSGDEVTSTQHTPDGLTSTSCSGDKLTSTTSSGDGLASSTIDTSTSATESIISTWLSWGEWTQCSSTCDTGIHRRYRQCEDGSICLGDYIESTTCEISPCLVYGKWSTWSSWGSCTVSCGEGKQVRERLCNKTNHIDVTDCVGVPVQEKTCSNWNCPDCSQICTDGKLNQACDTCKCDNMAISGRVFAHSTGNFLSDASFFVASAPTTAIGQCNLTGFFALNSTCLLTNLIVVRDGFIDTHVTVNDQEVDIYMDKIVLPFFTETPQSKQRLTGEIVTLCCDASANPDIEYYEWFKDSIVLDSSLYQNGKELTLRNVSLYSNGKYQCRANSPTGAILSTAAILSVKDRMDNFCVDALRQKVIALPEDCVQANTNTSTLEVGECIPKRCRAINSMNTVACREETLSRCSIKEAVFKTLHCIDYDVQVVVVTSCGCSMYPLKYLNIVGRALGFLDNSPVKYGEVWVNGIFKTYTSFSGDFNFIHAKTTNKITINVEDNFYRDFLSGFKILELPDEMDGKFYIEIKMLTPTEPIEIDPTKDNIFSAGSAENNSSKIQILIPPNAFYHPNGTVFNGNVKASLTFLDPTNVSTLESIPGDFRIVDEEGEDGKLESLGVFNMYFSDSSGQPLVLSDVVDMFIPLSLGDEEFYQEFKLLRLSSNTGYWEYVQPSTTVRRKRRTNTAVWIGDIDWSTVRNQEWFSYNKESEISDSPCYFRLKLYQDETMKSVELMTTRLFIDTHYINNTVLRTITNYMNTWYDTDNYCASVICENESAYTSLYYYERDSMHLYAIAPLMDAQNALEYSIDESETTLKIKMTKSFDGPFFDDENTCLTSNTTRFYLRYHFGHSKSFRPIEYFEEPLHSDVTDSTLQNNIRMRSLSAWYPKRDNSYHVCFIKVRVVFAPNTELLGGQKMKLTVTSRGGTDTQIMGKVFGVEQVDILNPLANASYCTEYKCSGKIPKFQGQDHYDNTEIKIKLHYPEDKITCEVTHESLHLSSSFNLASSSSLFGAYFNRQQLNSIGIYNFFDPSDFGPQYGTYKSKSDSLDVPSAKEFARNECKSGEQYSYKDVVDTRGVAVTFTCREI